jgi:glyoxylase-like metal-dependent hydrolase (beta-lactamase superfamily II)
MTQSSYPIVTRDPRNATPIFSAPPEEVAPGVLMHAQFSNTYALKTDVGLLLVDPGLHRLSEQVHRTVRAWSAAPIHTAAYTHGHIDHACGLRAFLAAGDRPHIIAQENCPKRFDRYRLTHGLNAAINSRQFGRNVFFQRDFEYPTLTFRDSLTQRMGELEITYAAAKGETDDHCYVWIPERGYLFSGDLIIWRAPNCGNPQKVQRYPVEWADALERMASLGADWLFPGHGLVVQGRDAVRHVLSDTASYLRIIIDQVLVRLNAGEEPEHIVHRVRSDATLACLPYLHEIYDHPQFIVRNLLRLWGGWWNGNAADLLPATFETQAKEITALAGGIAPIAARARVLLAEKNFTLAAHLAEWATRASPRDRDAQVLKRDVYRARLEAEANLMAQGVFRAAMNDARAALGEECLMRPGHAAL